MSGVEHDAPASHKPNQHHEEEHEEHVNHEAWVIPYADMLTLLMALFLMMWATSTQDEAKFAALAESLREAMGAGVGVEQKAVTDGAEGIMEGQTTGVEKGDKTDPSASDKQAAADALDREKERERAEKREEQALQGIQAAITQGAQDNNMLQNLQFRIEERGLIVSIVSDSVLFDPGSTQLKPQGESILRVVGASLANVPNQVQIEGHTDNSPINTAQYPSNWELSALRGTSVLRYLVDGTGFDGNRISSSGYGERRPVASNDTAAGKASNRRVEMVILRTDPGKNPASDAVNS